MTRGFIDRRRAAALMQEAGMEAMVLVQPETVRYATGASAGVASLWRRAGAAMVVVPADPAAPLAAVVGDLEADTFRAASGIADTRSHPIWVEATTLHRDEGGALDPRATACAGRMASFERPATFDAALALAQLRDILAERGLAHAPLGLELGFVPVADMAGFEAALPQVAWRDASPLVARLRMIKHPREIDHLRMAADLTTAGLWRLMSELRPGLDAGAIAALWRAEVAAEAERRSLAEPLSSWAYVSVGPDGFAPGGPGEPGDVVKMDVGAVVAGYSADMARTAVLGPPNPAQRRVHDALLEAFEAGVAALRPGRPLKEAHHAATQAMRRAGFAGYSRGHFGHGLGASIFSEEWPFIAADSEIPVEAGMVLAFETPYYVRGLGGFIVEDQFLVGETGLELMSPLPRALWEIGLGWPSPGASKMRGCDERRSLTRRPEVEA